ncbi:hypothetical protein, partial [Staphylococcus aureus]
MCIRDRGRACSGILYIYAYATADGTESVSYTHLRAHETLSDLVCRLLLEKNIMNAEEDAEIVIGTL